MHQLMNELKEKAYWITEHALEAKPLTLPDGLDYILGELRGQPVEMISKAWSTKDYRLIRYTGLHARGRISTFNFVIYPQDHYDAPIFASDWVMLGDSLRIAVIDAMPLFPQEEAYHQQWVRTFEPLHLQSLELAPVFERKLNWSTKYLGRAACLASNAPKESLNKLGALWESYLMHYLSLTKKMKRVNSNRKVQVRHWHKSYNRAHREVEDKRNPYMLYFGQEVGQRFNREFLFSDTFGR